MTGNADDGPDPPEGAEAVRLPWIRRGRTIPSAMIRPLQAFLELETSSGVLLLAAAVAAVAWANSPWSASYHSVWATSIGFRVGGLALFEPLRTWVAEPLLGLFFLVIGLELKREVLTGELRGRRTLAVPVTAALVGMAVPALIYLAVTAHTGGGAKGWAIPMATDVPFALGLLALAGRGLPPMLRTFLLTLAITDDIASLVVIGVFYPGHVDAVALVVELTALILTWVMFRIGLRAVALYAVMVVVVLVAAMRSGLHATLAGFVLGLLVPATPFHRGAAAGTGPSGGVASPLTRLETGLHPWTSNLIVPVFALANAGVTLTGSTLTATLTGAVFVAVLVARVIGKAVGVPLGAFAATATGIGRAQPGLGSRELLALGSAAGVGFTVPLLVIELAFGNGQLADQARAGLLAGSVVAAASGAMAMAFARAGSTGEPTAERR
jgi:Na+/H+ antiporter NhaA